MTKFRIVEKTKANGQIEYCVESKDSFISGWGRAREFSHLDYKFRMIPPFYKLEEAKKKKESLEMKEREYQRREKDKRIVKKRVVG